MNPALSQDGTSKSLHLLNWEQLERNPQSFTQRRREARPSARRDAAVAWKGSRARTPQALETQGRPFGVPSHSVHCQQQKLKPVPALQDQTSPASLRPSGGCRSITWPCSFSRSGVHESSHVAWTLGSASCRLLQASVGRVGSWGFEAEWSTEGYRYDVLRCKNASHQCSRSSRTGEVTIPSFNLSVGAGVERIAEVQVEEDK